MKESENQWWKLELGWASIQQSPHTRLDRGLTETHIWLSHDPTKTQHANEIQHSVGLLPFFLFSFSLYLNVFYYYKLQTYYDSMWRDNNEIGLPPWKA